MAHGLMFSHGNSLINLSIDRGVGGDLPKSLDY